VVIAVDAGLMVLLVLFTRRALAPYEALLARAKQAGGLAPRGGDEVDELVATFERAVAALAQSREVAGDDIELIERTLAPSLQSGLLVLDARGTVLALNPVGATLLGVTDPAPAVPLAELLGSRRELLELLLGAVEKGEEIRRAECPIEGPSGAMTLGLTAHPLRRADGGVRGHLVLFADLTEARARANEDRLAAGLAQLAELAGGIAHELRNSLATVRGYLSLAERSRDGDSLADYLGEIRGEADHLERVLEDFLSFARPGSVRMEPFPLARVLARVAADPALGGSRVTLEAADAADTAGMPWLRGDAQLIERAVRNLVRNAAEAVAGGPVEVTLRRAAEGWEIAILDRGPGVPGEIRDRLFHPFVTARPGGVGLGLSLAHRIVVLHQGRIRLEDREGGGTRAVITLPPELETTPPEKDEP
jgi:two-component system sensor histidine kinase PilS (NtrC family)